MKPNENGDTNRAKVNVSNDTYRHSKWHSSLGQRSLNDIQLRLDYTNAKRVEEHDVAFYEYSTLHGINDIYRAKNWTMRVIWLIIFMGAVVASFYGCGGIIAEYLEKPVVVSYFVQEPENNTLEVPDIVICPFNRFNRSYLLDLNISEALAQYLELSFPSPPIHTFQQNLMDVAIANIKQQDDELYEVLARLGNLSYGEFLERASLHCSAFIIEPHNCSQMETVLTSAGKCVRVPGTTQSGAGYGYGKRVVVRLPHTLFNPGINQLLNNGIAVKLAEHGKGLNHGLMFVPAGSHAILPLKATRYKFMDDPPRYICDKKIIPNYSRQNCFDSCLIEKAEMDCSCRLAPSSNRQPNLPTCTTLLFFTCFYQHFFYSQKNQETTCRLRCLPPCEYWEYTGSMSYAKFPSPEAKAFVTNASELEALEQTIILNVFFEQLEYTLIKHVVAMTPVSFIAQLGGQISLFVGGSIMTIFQAIIYGAQRLWRLLCSRRWWSYCRTTSYTEQEQPETDGDGTTRLNYGNSELLHASITDEITNGASINHRQSTLQSADYSRYGTLYASGHVQPELAPPPKMYPDPEATTMFGNHHKSSSGSLPPYFERIYAAVVPNQ